MVNWGRPRIPGWLVPRFLLYFPKQTRQERWVTEFNLFPSGFSFYLMYHLHLIPFCNFWFTSQKTQWVWPA